MNNTTKKIIRYASIGTILSIIVHNSYYVRSLSEMKAANQTETFDATGYAKQYWDTKITPALTSAIELPELLKLLMNDRAKAFKEHSNALSIGNTRYFMIKGQGEVTSVNEDDVIIISAKDTIQVSVRLAMEFVYGNAVRDAVGGINLNEFQNTSSLNAVSAEINKKIRTEVIPEFKASLKSGATVEYAGAIELNQKHLDLANIEVIPVALTLTTNSVK